MQAESKEKTTDVEDNQKSDSKSSEGNKKAGPANERSVLIEGCIGALSLCLSRFPQHYKSLYRLAKAYFILDSHKVGGTVAFK